MSRHNAIKLEITYIRTELITIRAEDARKHSEEQVSMIFASIGRFDAVLPVLVARSKVGPTFNLIDGKAFLQAATLRGMSEVPAIIVDHLSEVEQRALRIALNKSQERGAWSVDLLAQEVCFLLNSELDFTRQELGFDVGELDFLVANASGEPANPEPGVLEPDRRAPAVSRIGDVWTISDHKVGCGDTTSAEIFDAVMGIDRAAAVISDGPYNVPVIGHVSTRPKGYWREFPQASGEMTREQFKEFLHTTMSLQALYSAPGALNFSFIDWRSIADMITVGETIYDALVNVAVWVKPSGGMGSLWRSRHELVCVFRVKGGKHRNFVNLGKHGRYRTNVWEYPSPGGFGSERANLKLHPTCKNITMVRDAIMDCTERGDLVLDAFLGSGTTVLGAHRSGRRGRGIELDPHYVDLAISRIADEVRVEPVLGDGRPFSAVSRDRSAGGVDAQ